MTSIANLNLTDTTGIPSNIGVTGVTFGVTRESDGSVILPPSAVAEISTGHWRYDYTSLGLDPSIAYLLTWVIEGLGQTVVRRVGGEARQTLLAYVMDIIRTGRLGKWGRYTVSTTPVLPDPIPPSYYRELQSNALIDFDSRANATAWDAAHACLVTGAQKGQERRIITRGYSPSEGKLTVAGPYGGVQGLGVEFLLTSKISVMGGDGEPGLRDFINRALEVCLVPDRVTLQATAGYRSYDVTTDLVDLSRPDLRFGNIYNPAVSIGEPQVWSGILPTLVQDAHVRRLELDSAFSSPTVEVGILRPASTWIYAGGAWGSSSAGLVSLDDRALIEPIIVRELALQYIYDYFLEHADPSERQEMQRKYDQQSTRAGLVKFLREQRENRREYRESSTVVRGGRWYESGGGGRGWGW
jgi:hypothetical protein